jgi:hypothetical protein
MHRKFEEVGFDVGGGSYGLFSGEAEWDTHGDIVAIELETSGTDGKPLALSIQELVRERIALRQKYGIGFLEQTERAPLDHARRWFLFQGLSDALQDIYAEDVEDALVSLRTDARAGRRSGAA